MNADGSGKREADERPRLGNRCGVVARRTEDRAFARVRDGGEFEIHVMNVDGSGQRKLTREARGEGHLVWSPDGEQDRVRAPSGRATQRDLRDERRRERAAEADEQHGGETATPVWSPDGQRIAFERIWQVNVMNAMGAGSSG